MRRGREEKLWLGKVRSQYVLLSLLQREKSSMIEAGEINELTVDFVIQQTDRCIHEHEERRENTER